MEREIKDTAICIKNADVADYDRYVYLLTPRFGLIKAKMRGVKKPKAKLAYASFPFCMGEYLLVKTGNNYTVTGCNYIDNFTSITTDINCYFAGSAVLDMAFKLVKENQDSSQHFVNVVKSLNALCYNNANIFSVLSKFILLSLKTMGFGISLQNSDKPLKYFNFEQGLVHAEFNDDSVELTDEMSQSLQELYYINIEDITEATQTKKAILRILLSFAENKLDEQFEVMQNFVK